MRNNKNTATMTNLTQTTDNQKVTTKSIINDLNNGVQYGNHNTDFIYKDGEMLMCEYTEDCKFTKYYTIEKFARRILRFTKIGY